MNQEVFLGPPEFASFVFLVLLKDGECRVSPRFQMFVSDVNQGNEEVRWVKDILV